MPGRHWGRGRWHRHGEGWGEWGNEWRARRGNMKYLLLEALAEQPRHGYDVMRFLEERYKGAYRPSPGSVYPTLQMLEEGGYLSSEMVDGKRVYSITDAGRALLAERGSTGEDDEEGGFPQGFREVIASVHQLRGAVRQALGHLDKAKIEEIHKIIDEARRKIYKVLAD